MRAVLDANVLFPFSLRDTLLRAAAAGLYQPAWTKTILEEATRNLVATRRMTPAQATRLTSVMCAAFPEAMVHGHHAYLSAMSNDPKDRHVAAAAIAGGATCVVACNLRDFEPMPDGVAALHPDDFLCSLWEHGPATLVDVVREQARALSRPPVPLSALLDGLETTVPRFAQRVRAAVGPPTT